MNIKELGPFVEVANRVALWRRPQTGISKLSGVYPDHAECVVAPFDQSARHSDLHGPNYAVLARQI
jgi:hypothetical protein